MFEGWDNYYIIVGPSAGALIGLMFVVETLTSESEPRGMELGAKVYISPIVFHFAVALVLSALTQVPGLSAVAVAVPVVLLGLGGAVYGVVTTARLGQLAARQLYQPDLSDRCFYGYFPTLMYLALAGTGATLVVDEKAGVYALAAVTMAVLLIGIRNAWDLVTAIVKTLARKRAERRTN